MRPEFWHRNRGDGHFSMLFTKLAVNITHLEEHLWHRDFENNQIPMPVNIRSYKQKKQAN